MTHHDPDFYVGILMTSEMVSIFHCQSLKLAGVGVASRHTPKGLLRFTLASGNIGRELS